MHGKRDINPQCVLHRFVGQRQVEIATAPKDKNLQIKWGFLPADMETGHDRELELVRGLEDPQLEETAEEEITNTRDAAAAAKGSQFQVCAHAHRDPTTIYDAALEATPLDRNRSRHIVMSCISPGERIREGSRSKSILPPSKRITRSL